MRVQLYMYRGYKMTTTGAEAGTIIPIRGLLVSIILTACWLLIAKFHYTARTVVLTPVPEKLNERVKTPPGGTCA